MRQSTYPNQRITNTYVLKTNNGVEVLGFEPRL